MIMANLQARLKTLTQTNHKHRIAIIMKAKCLGDNIIYLIKNISILIKFFD